ncbi:MAG TPA: 3'(2'),5'-bisphosphate nucleotidase CysQ [Steroidobacteraceae bacterium]|nr:3'(2'),5'-bisphosphate nucleotidase CysQ [Steroidobacteraceae bacterium]
MSQSSLLSALIDTALAAGNAINQIYHGTFEVTLKADASPVTAADHAAEELILAALAAQAPGTPVVAEEQMAAGHAPVVGEEFFLVDPLDGTKEFVQRRGEFTVNIALVRRGAPVLGVVHAPATGVVYAGDVETAQAWRLTAGGRREQIRVRAVPQAGFTAVASRSHRTPATDRYLAGYRIAELVSVGSSLKFCLVAAGEADLYPRLGPTMEWDTAAGHAVLVAAGGTVLAADGLPLTYGKPRFKNPSFVAAGACVPRPPVA